MENTTLFIAAGVILVVLWIATIAHSLYAQQQEIDNLWLDIVDILIKRSDLIPLLLVTITEHQSVKHVDKILAIRQRCLQGNHIGPRMIMERKLALIVEILFSQTASKKAKHDIDYIECQQLWRQHTYQFIIFAHALNKKISYYQHMYNAVYALIPRLFVRNRKYKLVEAIESMK